MLNISQLYQALTKVEDKRDRRGQRYSLAILLIVVILAKLSGEDKPYGIAEWAKMRGKELQALLGYKRCVSPSHNTIRRLMSDYLRDEDLQAKTRQFLHEAYGGQESVLLVIDGKTLRGTIPKGQTRGVHLLAAYLPEEGVVLLQVEVGHKENEIVAAPKLLNCLHLQGRVVSGDAMFTQRDISVTVLAQGGDYIWHVKDNQPTLHQDVQRFFTPPRQTPGWQAPVMPQQVATDVCKQSGRVETRCLTLIPDRHHYLPWPGLTAVFKLERQVCRPTTGETYSDVTYGITSLPYTPAAAHTLLHHTRNHWGIENGLHYRRDVTLQEDATRMKHPHQARVLATLNNFVVALVNYLGFRNLASARRFFQARLDAILFSL